MLIISMLCMDIMAQPTPNAPASNSASQFGIRRSVPAPIAPATLLLLGLGGATVGTMVYRNSRKGGEK